MRHVRLIRAAVRALAVVSLLATVGSSLRAAGTITGVVFEDFNGNGRRDLTDTVTNAGGIGSVGMAIDRGVGGIAVAVYDNGGALRGSTTTLADGSYSLSATGTGPYRVEFANLPAGYRPSAMATGATGNATTVQFVPDGNSADVNLGILDGANFCQNNPTLVTTCFVFGDAAGPFSANPAVVDFPYSAGSDSVADAPSYTNPSAHALAVPVSGVGAVYGLAYRAATNTVYTSAYMKKHSGFGPGGTGAIYQVSAGGAASVYADLNTIYPPGTAGFDPHDTADFSRDNGNVAWDAVGKRGLGGLEISPDGRTLYVVNLADRHVYAVPTSGALTTASVPRVSIPLNAPGATGPGGADLRPFAIQWYRNRLYVGIVNSAESTQLTSDLIGYVYELDPVAFTFGAAPILQFRLDYPRGVVQDFTPPAPGEWQPWRPTFATRSPDPIGVYPQPMLSGLAFDSRGNVTIGLRDRAGDQFGVDGQTDPATNVNWFGVAGGDTLLAAIVTPGTPSGGYILESNAQAGSFGPSLGANNNQGPGALATGFGEFYAGDNFIGGVVTHDEVSGGSLLQVPGYPDVVVSAFDPGLLLRTGGFIWLGQSTGARTKGYQLFESIPGPPPSPTFSKANGFGEVVAICQAAPIEIGNRVWDDIDGDGVQDAGELGLDGVTVQLIAPGGAVLATTTTAGGGQYYFSSGSGSAPGGVYGIAGLTPNTAGFRIRLSTTQGSLGGRRLTTGNADGSANGDSRDSDGVQATATLAEAVVNTGAPGANDHTFDFGFTLVPPAMSLGNLVWYDTNDNGVVDAGEQPINGVDVVLYRDTGDGVFNPAVDAFVGTQTTSGGGSYLFTGLTPGTYFVGIPSGEFTAGQPLNGYQNSSGQTNGDVNNADHGAPFGSLGIVSGPVVMAAGTESTSDGDADPNTNLTIDFGFYKLTLGNLVFLDADNSGTFNAGDTPRDGVTVELRDGTGSPVATTVTAGGGLYVFMGLTPGNYRVCFTPPAGFTSSTGGASEPAPDPDVDADDNDDNGSLAGGVICSELITLTPGAEPTVNNANGETQNMTLDFGLIAFVGGGVPVDICLQQTLPTTVAPGGQMTATYTANNRGPGVAADVVIDGMLPPGVTVVSTTPSTGGTCTATTDMLDCRWPGATPVGPSGVRQVTVVFQVASTVPPGTPLPLWFMTSSGNTDPYEACNMVDGYIFTSGGTSGSADLRITGAATAAGASGASIAAAVNAPITSRFTVTNTGSVPARGRYAILIDEAGVVEIPSATWTQGWVGVTNPTAGVWETELIAPGASAVLNLAMVPRRGTASRIQLIRTEGSPTDPDATNDAAEIVVDAVDAQGGGRFVAAGDVDGAAGAEIVTGAGRGETPQVRVFSGVGASVASFYAFERSFTGGVRVASCNVTGDTRDEIIVAQGPGGGRVRVVSFAGGIVADVASFDAFESGFTGGINVACADLDGDGRAEVVVGPEGGRAPDVKVFTVGAGAATSTAQFQAYEAGYTGGVRVAAGRFAGSGLVPALNIVTMPGPGRALEVRTWQVAGSSATMGLGATLSSSPTGARVALGDVNNDGGLDVLVMPDGGAPTLIQAYSLATGALVLNAPAGTGGYRSVIAATGVLAGGPGSVELIIGRGPGEAPTVATFLVGGGGAVMPRLNFAVLEEP